MIKTFPSDDKKVRKVEIRTNKDGHLSTCVRPVNELVLLVQNDPPRDSCPYTNDDLEATLPRRGVC